MVAAVAAFKRRHPQITEARIGPKTYPHLVEHVDEFAGWLLLHTPPAVI